MDVLSRVSVRSAEQLVGLLPDRLDVDLVLTDPPYGTGKRQQVRGVGYKDPKPGEAVALTVSALIPLVDRLAPAGVVAVFCDHRVVHRLAVAVEDEVGLTYRSDLVWHSELGRGASKWWSMKHQTILLFDRGGNGLFNQDGVPMVARKAPVPGYEGDKIQDSVFHYTMSNSHSERVGYPGQKPRRLLDPLVAVHSPVGGCVVDPFCGSGSSLVAARALGRVSFGCDVNPEAVRLAGERLNNIT